MMKRHIIPQSATVIEALASLNNLSGGVMTLFVTDEDNRLAGTLTDGDLRRALLRGVRLSDNVTEAIHRQFKAVNEDEINVSVLRDCREKGIVLMPVLDKEGHIVKIIDLTVTHNLLPLSAILMAGGIGERLRPMTLTVPKPLLKIDGKPIIDYNIESLAASGITDITVTTRYLAEQIHDHFKEPVAGVKVKCVTEKNPLGTIGAASLVSLPEKGNTLIMNSDLLTTISFEDLYLKHIEEDAAITIAAVPYVLSVPYAILTTRESRVTGLEEKPTYSYYANAGIYIISNRLLKQLKSDERTDATTLIENAIGNGEKVVYFPINGTWIDIGSPVDFRHAEELMKHHRNFTR